MRLTRDAYGGVEEYTINQQQQVVTGGLDAVAPGRSQLVYKDGELQGAVAASGPVPASAAVAVAATAAADGVVGNGGACAPVAMAAPLTTGGNGVLPQQPMLPASLQQQLQALPTPVALECDDIPQSSESEMDSEEEDEMDMSDSENRDHLEVKRDKVSHLGQG
jgi:hypothetical protein